MSDPIQAFIDAGGFQPVADPESEQVRERARQLVRAALKLALSGGPDSSAQLPPIWEQILHINRHGGGVVTAVEELVFLWRHLVGLYASLPPLGDEEVWQRASQIATGLTVPAAPLAPVALTLEVPQNDELAIAVMVTLTKELARRLYAAAQILDEIGTSADTAPYTLTLPG